VTPPLFRTTRTAIVGELLTLDGPEGRHAADVRRLLAGEPIMLTDGGGGLISGSVAAVRRGELDVTVEAVEQVPPPALRLVVVQALAKGGRDEDAVEAMTEVGVDEFVGWQASRSIAKWTDRTAVRWRSTVDAAAKQSRRSWWPVVSGPASTSDVVDRLRAADQSLVLSESSHESLTSVAVPASGEVVIVVGPEGGISPAEETAFADAGAAIVRLGHTVLRSSTAGVVASALISAQSRWR
jgi:16S rRNA (uracil1498-N3)-methyltransferase